jgi:hypothetical protein
VTVRFQCVYRSFATSSLTRSHPRVHEGRPRDWQNPYRRASLPTRWRVFCLHGADFQATIPCACCSGGLKRLKRPRQRLATPTGPSTRREVVPSDMSASWSRRTLGPTGSGQGRGSGNASSASALHTSSTTRLKPLTRRGTSPTSPTSPLAARDDNAARGQAEQEGHGRQLPNRPLSATPKGEGTLRKAAARGSCSGRGRDLRGLQRDGSSEREGP